MKKITIFIFTVIMTACLFILTALADEKGIFPQFTSGNYTIVATTRHAMVAPHSGSFWMYSDYGVTDKDGNFIVEPIYSKINEPSDGRALYRKSSEDGTVVYGYFDENWKVIENMKYDEARDFSDGVAVVGVNIGAPSPIATTMRYGVTDKSGRLIVPIEYHYISDAKDGIIAAQLYEQTYPITEHSSRIAYYSTDGKLLEEPIFRHTKDEYEVVTHVNPVRFGDTLVENPSMKYPLVNVTGNGVYLPLTAENCKMLGIGISGNHLEGVKLRREPAEPCKDGLGKSIMPKDGKVSMVKYGGAIIIDGVYYTNNDAPHPMLYYKDTVYLPLYWTTLLTKLGLSYSYDLGMGIRIGTENHKETVPTAIIPTFDVTFNGIKIDNNNRQYPLIVYKDITYLPMTYHDCRFLGLVTMWDNDTRTLSIESDSNISCTYRDYRQESPNEGIFSPTVCDFNIVVNERTIKNDAEIYPLITFRDVTYFPLTWRFAVDEFYWEYEFTEEKGLVISSSNCKTSKLELPYYNGGDYIFDDSYYYYNATLNGKNYVCRAKIKDTEKTEMLYELTNASSMGNAEFSKGGDGIYFIYHTGEAPSNLKAVFKKINSDGTVTDGRNQQNYSYGKAGEYELYKEEHGISVYIHAGYVENVINKIVLNVNGEEKEITDYPKSLSITYCMVDGKRIDRIPTLDSVQVLGGKVYISAYDFDKKSGSNDLFVIDIDTEKFERLIENIHGGFYAYHGPLYSETDVIIFGRNGKTMRYTSKDGKIAEVDTSPETSGMILEKAYGDEKIFTVWRTLGGDKTKVQRLGSHGLYSHNETVFETTTGAFFRISDGHLVIYTYGESPNDNVRLAVFPWRTDFAFFLTSDAVADVYVYGDAIVYKTLDGILVRVESEKNRNIK